MSHSPHIPRRATSGFTLLEMMVALAILAVSLTGIIEATQRAIVTQNHAKLLTTATFLARARLVELEEELAQKGFADESFATESSGDFDDKGFKRFKWTMMVDKVELPGSVDVETLVTKGMETAQTVGGGAGKGEEKGDKGGGGANPMSAATGMAAGMYGQIKDMFEQAIRRARVKITWSEGRREHAVEIVEYLTDPMKIDQIMPGGNFAPPPPDPDKDKKPPPPPR